MDWNDMQGRWQETGQKEADGISSKPPGSRQKLWGLVRRRDYLETGIAVLLLPVFAGLVVFYGMNEKWVSAAFLLLVVAGIAVIPWQLWRTRRLVPAPDHAGTVLDYLKAELKALGAQEQQSRWVFIWYFLPIGIGVIGAYTSTVGLNLDSLKYAAAVAGLGVAIDWMNRYWAARKFRDAAAEIRSQIESMESER